MTSYNLRPLKHYEKAFVDDSPGPQFTPAVELDQLNRPLDLGLVATQYLPESPQPVIQNPVQDLASQPVQNAAEPISGANMVAPQAEYHQLSEGNAIQNWSY